MDGKIITDERLFIIKDRLCPDPTQLAQLEEMHREHPDVPFAAPESVMWAISRAPFYSARVHCWYFIRNYEEQAVMCTTQLAQFQRFLDAFLSSNALCRTMALILSIGNY